MAASAAEDQDINEPLAERSLKLRDLVHSAVIQKRHSRKIDQPNNSRN